MNDIDLDFERQQRIGMPEIVYGEFKTAGQIRRIADIHEERKANMLITRCQPEQIDGLPGDYDPLARTYTRLHSEPEPLTGLVGVVAAGTSDAGVAREAANTLRILGCPFKDFLDCGVAGVHRLIKHSDDLKQCQVLICVAGFEGALASVIAGLFSQPIIGVPTSVGYGVAKGGTAALNAMLASCAGGVSVMNIDNGCGAAMAAHRILYSRQQT